MVWHSFLLGFTEERLLTFWNFTAEGFLTLMCGIGSCRSLLSDRAVLISSMTMGLLVLLGGVTSLDVASNKVVIEDSWRDLSISKYT